MATKQQATVKASENTANYGDVVQGFHHALEGDLIVQPFRHAHAHSGELGELSFLDDGEAVIKFKEFDDKGALKGVTEYHAPMRNWKGRDGSDREGWFFSQSGVKMGPKGGSKIAVRPLNVSMQPCKPGSSWAYLLRYLEVRPW